MMFTSAPLASGPDIYQFWVAVAQIIPVLAIPLVFEARALALREGSHRDQRRRQRLVWGVVLAILAASMICMQLIALNVVAFGGSTEALIYAALAVIAGALAVVFILPVTLIVSALSTETVWRLLMLFPRHPLQKLKKEASAGLGSAKSREGQLMGQHGDALGMVATQMTNDARQKRAASLVRGALARPLDTDPATDARVRAELGNMLADFESEDPKLTAKIQQTVASIDRELDKTREQKTAWQALIDDIEALIRSGATPKQLEELSDRLRNLGAS